MGQVRALARFRWLALRHRALQHGWAPTFALFALAAGLLVGAGFALIPADLGPQRAGGGVVHWGGWTLETAFVIACLLAVIQSFRILEAFFRHPDARFLATFPVRLPALFAYRLITALGDSLLLALGGVLFLLPTGLTGAWPQFLGGAALLLAAAVLVVAVGFAAQIGAGIANYARLPIATADSGNGPGSAPFVLAPGIALGASLILTLLGKLTLDEVFKAHVQGGPALPGIARAALALLLVVVSGSLLWSWRGFVRHFPVLFARFFESDLVSMDVGYDYFARDRRPPRGLEARLSGPVRTLYRLDRLQLARRAPLARFAKIGGWVAAAIAYLGYGGNLEPWSVLAVALAWLLLVANPWSRLFHPDLEPGMGSLLPVEPRVRARARLILLVHEVALLGLPFVALGLALPDWERRLAAIVAIPAAFAALPWLMRLAERSHRAPRAAGFLLVIVLAASTQLGIWAPWVAAALLAGSGVYGARWSSQRAVAAT